MRGKCGADLKPSYPSYTTPSQSQFQRLLYTTMCWKTHPKTLVHVVDDTIHLTSDGESHLCIDALFLLNLTPQFRPHYHREGRKARLRAAHGKCHQVCVVPWTKSKIQHYSLYIAWSLVFLASNNCTDILWLSLKCIESHGVLG